MGLNTEFATDNVSAKFYRLLTLAIVLLGIVGIGSIGLNLITKYWQTKQLQQMQQASKLLAQGQYQSAIAAYDRLIETDTAQPQILWANRGYAYLGLNRYKSALESCSQATDLNPKAALAWNCQGEAQFNLGNSDAALNDLERASALKPKDAIFKLNQSQVLQDLGQHRQAIKVNQEAIALLESQSPADNILALAYKRQGQNWLELQENQEALTAFQKSLAERAEDLAAQQGKAVALYRLGNYERAIATLDKILSRKDLTSEQQATSWLYKGISLCQTPQASTAKKAFAKVLELTENPQSRKIAKAGCGIK